MPQTQTKNLLVNILTAAVILGVIVAGYFVFVGNQPAPTDVVAVAPVQVAADTVAVGAEIARTIGSLQDLKNSVEKSATVFSMPEFKNLQDFSVEVAPESVGRDNPFILPDWKLKIKALEESVKQGGSVPTSSLISAPAQSQSQQVAPAL